MPRVRANVSLNGKTQSFELESVRITVGKLPGSTLVLPLIWVGDTHVVVMEGAKGGIHVQPGSDLDHVMSGGGLLGAEGRSFGKGEEIELELPAPSGETLKLELLPLRPTVMVDAGASNRLKAELVLAGLVLAGVVGLAVYALGKHGNESPKAETAAAVPPPSVKVEKVMAEPGKKDIEIAALSFLAGDLPGARDGLNRATAAGARGPLVDAIALAVRNEQARRDTKATEASIRPMVPPVPAADPNKVTFEGQEMTIARRDEILKERAEAQARERVKREEAAQLNGAAEAAKNREEEVRKLLVKADSDAKEGRNAKLTETGRRALNAAKAGVKAKLGGQPVSFPEDTEDRVVVVFDQGVYTIRGFVDQTNGQNVPVRLFYLAKVKPAGAETFDVVGIDFLQ